MVLYLRRLCQRGPAWVSPYTHCFGRSSVYVLIRYMQNLAVPHDSYSPLSNSVNDFGDFEFCSVRLRGGKDQGRLF